LNKKIVSGITLTLLLLSMLTLAFNIELVEAEPGTWTVDDDGPADFSTIQEAINSPLVNTGDTIFVRTGTYYEHVVLSKSVLLIGEDKDSTVIDGSESYHVVRITADYVTITNFTIRNSRHQYADDSAIRIDRHSHNIIKGNVILNSLVSIYLDEAHNNTICDNEIIAPSQWYTIWLKQSHHNIIQKNLITNNSGSGIILWSSNWNTVNGNNVTGIPTLPTANGQGIVLYAGSHSNVVSNNRLVYNKYSGVSLMESEGNVIQDNIMEHNYLGIYSWKSSNIIHRNTVSNNGYGIDLFSSSNNVLTGNNASNNWSGIGLSSSSNNTLTGNTASSNNWSGIWLSVSSNNVLTGNNASNNGYGIQLKYSSSNNIYHNNFVDNGNQVFSYRSVSIWDDGYPSGGNYWGDHVTLDDCSGINQDEPGSDGIVDEPYIIDDYNRDNYPLVEPWSPVISVTIDIDPDTLNLKSKGEWITCYIELPEGYNVSDIDIYSLRLNDTLPVSLLPNPPVPVPTEIGDYDIDGIPDLMVKFNRTLVSELLLSKGIMYGNVTLTIAGEVDGTPFEGTDVIKVLFPGDVDDDGDCDMFDFSLFAVSYATSVDDIVYNWFADFNEDQNIDLFDFSILAQYYGKTAV